MPILRLDVCSESEATFTCVVMESILSWDIDFQDKDDININRVMFTCGEGPTELISIHNRGPTYVIYQQSVILLLMQTFAIACSYL